jgi:hypothetical protein
MSKRGLRKGLFDGYVIHFLIDGVLTFKRNEVRK